MKKVDLKTSLICSLIFIITSFTAAQSDYNTVQSFQTDCEEIERQIKKAGTTEEIQFIPTNIEQFASKYSRHSELLDKALYPEGYETTINRLNSMFTSRERDITMAENLKVEVSTLQVKLDTLSVLNTELSAKLEELQIQIEKNSKETAQLNRLVANLKASLQKRDVLVMSMIDSLMPPVMREKPTLSSEDKENIKSNVEQDNILVNIKTTIEDNIKYLNITSLQPEDIEELKGQQLDFAETWAQIGPKLAEVYSSDKNRGKELWEIDSLFSLWAVSVNEEVWQSIKEDFEQKGIALETFSDGEEFTNSVNQYIESEKKTISAVPEEQAKQSFELFADQTWSSEIKPKWSAFLIENGMLSETNQDVIEENIDVWRSELYTSNIWLWIIILGVFTAGLAILLARLKRNSQMLQDAAE
jgi:hypothetical protein